MEIADIFVVNKADREVPTGSCRQSRRTRRQNLETEDWRPPIIKTVATTGAGVTDLDLAIKLPTHAAGRQADRRKTRSA